MSVLACVHVCDTEALMVLDTSVFIVDVMQSAVSHITSVCYWE